MYRCVTIWPVLSDGDALLTGSKRLLWRGGCRAEPTVLPRVFVAIAAGQHMLVMVCNDGHATARPAAHRARPIRNNDRNLRGSRTYRDLRHENVAAADMGLQLGTYKQCGTVVPGVLRRSPGVRPLEAGP